MHYFFFKLRLIPFTQSLNYMVQFLLLAASMRGKSLHMIYTLSSELNVNCKNLYKLPLVWLQLCNRRRSSSKPSPLSPPTLQQSVGLTLWRTLVCAAVIKKKATFIKCPITVTSVPWCFDVYNNITVLNSTTVVAYWCCHCTMSVADIPPVKQGPRGWENARKLTLISQCPKGEWLNHKVDLLDSAAGHYCSL